MSADFADKRHAARRSTHASIVVNVLLSAAQLAAGTIAHSQALIADGAHSLADLVSDGIVLFAHRRGSAKPDADHNYGHSRYETVASLFLGGLLIAVGAGMLARAGMRLTALNEIVPVHPGALVVAVVVLAVKEGLFRFMLREATRVRSPMLIANAWHARSDAASSLVVGLGIVGSLAGFRLFDPIAALIVGFMIGKMGFSFAWESLQDLSDRALDAASAARIQALIAATPGVADIHELRTRKTGDFALVDAHILVDPLISVSEGHYIAEAARRQALTEPRVLDALIHVDPENDLERRPPPGLPTRAELTARLRSELAQRGAAFDSVNIHYLSRGIEMDVVLASSADAEFVPDPQTLSRALGVREVRLARRVA